MRPEDRVRLLHILDAGDAVARFVGGRKREDLDSDEMLLFAVVRAIEVIGEAASRLSRQAREEAPGVPWGEMAGMRNRLIHTYYEVDHDIVWQTATQDVPSLMRELQRLRDLPPAESEPDPSREGDGTST